MYKVVTEFYLKDRSHTSIDVISTTMIQQALENNPGYDLFQVIFSGDSMMRMVLKKI